MEQHNAADAAPRGRRRQRRSTPAGETAPAGNRRRTRQGAAPAGGSTPAPAAGGARAPKPAGPQDAPAAEAPAKQAAKGRAGRNGRAKAPAQQGGTGQDGATRSGDQQPGSRPVAKKPSGRTAKTVAKQAATKQPAAKQGGTKKAAGRKDGSRDGRGAQPGARVRGERGGRHASGPSGHVTGVLRLHARGFGFVEHAGGGDLFCPAELARLAMDGDEVAGDYRGDRMVRLQVVRRVRTEVVGTVNGTDGRRVLELDDHIGSGELELVGRARKGQTVVARLDGDKAVVVDRLDGFEDSVRARVLVRAQLPREMPADAPPARCVPLAPGARRRDLRDVVTLTIDDQHSMDLDDALSVAPADADGCIRLLVHIADVAEHVVAGSAADLAARDTATSIYLHPWVRPMLPRNLSEDTLSLVPGAERDTLTVELRVDPEGEVVSVDLYESRTRSDGRVDYDLASKVLREEDAHVPEELRETLRWLRTVSARLGVARQRRGGLAARFVEPELRGQGEARDLIERCMVAANEAVARWMAERGLVGLWRVHDQPGAEELAEIAELTARLGFHAGFGPQVTPRAMAALDAQIASTGDERTKGLWHATLERMSRARYTATPGGHFGLGSGSYTHFTSPIRRYADLVVHRVVKAHLRGEAAPVAARDDMEALAVHINAQAGRADRAEAQLRSSRRLVELARRKGVCDGWVTAARESALRVWLDVGVRAHMPMRSMDGRWAKDGVCAVGPNGRRICPGERIKVKIVALDVDNGVVEVAPA